MIVTKHTPIIKAANQPTTSGEANLYEDMKADIQYILPCDYATIDSDDKPTAVGIFDLIRLGDNPQIITNFFVVSKIQIKDDVALGNKKINLQIIDPDGNEIANAEMVDSGGEDKTRKVGVFAQFTLVKIAKKGVHEFKVLIDDVLQDKSCKIDVV